jgi:hypothetical protein
MHSQPAWTHIQQKLDWVVVEHNSVAVVLLCFNAGTQAALLGLLVCFNVDSALHAHRKLERDNCSSRIEGDKSPAIAVLLFRSWTAIAWLCVSRYNLSHCGAVRDHHGPGIASDEGSSCLAVEPCHRGLPGASLPVSSTWRCLSICELKSYQGCMP